jgi:hypothetical protein
MANDRQIPVKDLIHFWEESIKDHIHQMSVTSVVFTEQTIMRLKELGDMSKDDKQEK